MASGSSSPLNRTQTVGASLARPADAEHQRITAPLGRRATKGRPYILIIKGDNYYGSLQ